MERHQVEEERMAKGVRFFVIYEGTDQMSKYAKDLGSRISQCWERESHTWRGSKLD